MVSQDKTIEEALFNLREVVDLYLESFSADDLPESTGEVLLYPMEVTVGG